MKFKYRLALLLKMAAEKERQEKTELGRLIQERMGITNRIQEIGQKMSYWYQQYNEVSANPFEVGLIENHLSFIDKQKQELLKMVRVLEDKIKAKRKDVNEAYKEKRKYELHEEFKRNQFYSEQEAKENAQVADLVQMHFINKKQREATI